MRSINRRFTYLLTAHAFSKQDETVVMKTSVAANKDGRPTGSIFSCRAKDCGLLGSWTTNHNKASVRGLVSQPITAHVRHISRQLLVATLQVAGVDPLCL